MIQHEIKLWFGRIRSHGNGRVEVDQAVFHVESGPEGETAAVGIGGAGKVGPVAHDLFAKGAIFWTPSCAAAGIEGTEHIFEFVGVPHAI